MTTRLASLLGLLAILANCGGPAQEASSESEGSNEGKSFAVAFTSIGIASVPLLAALDDMRGHGYEIEVIEIAESDLAIEGVSRGEFAISSAGAAPVAVAQGANLTVVADRNSNEFTLYATSDIESCEDLNGRRLAIHSEGGTSTAMVRHYIESECPGTEPNYVVIAGSPNRYAALVAGEIESSPLELSEAISLESEQGKRFRMITSFAQSLPFLHNANVYGNSDFVQENPETIKALIRALIKQHREISDSPEYLEQIVREYWPEAPTEILDKAAERYVELELFDVNGGLTEENLQSTIDFYTDAGFIEDELTVDALADLSYLNDVLDEVGRQ